MSWENLCYPTEERGLGFRSLEDIGTAFSSKLWWRMRQRGSIWSDFIFSKYIGDQHPLQVELTRPTGAWKRLIGVRVMADAHITRSLGPGMMNFWLDTSVSLDSYVPCCQRVVTRLIFWWQNSWDGMGGIENASCNGSRATSWM